MHKYLSKASGKQIKKYRKDMKLSQDQLAEKTNLSKTFISHIENGENASIDSLINIANSLGITLDDIFYDSLKYCKQPVTVKLNYLFEDCTATELKHILNTSKALLSSLRNTNIGDE